MSPVEISSYDDLLAALVARRRELGLSQCSLNIEAGTQDGYVSKIEARMRHLGPVSLPLILAGLGLVLELEEIDEAAVSQAA